jgi:uncharacterized membrane protein YfcA
MLLIFNTAKVGKVHIDWAIAAAGLGVGFIVGLTGMGGGALMTPVLVLIFGIDPTKAVGSDIVVSLLMKPVGGGVHLRRGTVHLKLAAWLIVGSVPSAFLAVWLLHLFTDPEQLNSLVQLFLGVALLLASAALAAKGAFSGRRRVEHALDTIEVHPVPTLLIGVFGGAMVGITSVGSGSLMMPLLLMLYPALTARQLVGTDLIQAIPLVASAALAHAVFVHDIELSLTASLLIGALPGAYLGARVSSRAPDRIIRPALAVILVVSGLKMLEVPSMAVGLIALVLTAVAVVFTVRHRNHDPELVLADVST